MVAGLNKWCQDQSVPWEVVSALRNSKLWPDDVARLKELRQKASGDDGNLAKKEVLKHKLQEIKIHNSKSKDGYVKLFWLLNTPTAQTLAGERWGKGKGKGSKTKGISNAFVIF